MSNDNFESLMRDVARAVQTDARRRQLLPEIQSRMAALDEQSRQSRRAHGPWRLALLGAAACAAGVAFFVMRPSPVSFAVDGAGAGAGHAGAVGERLVAPEAAPLSLRFSDGSRVTLPPRAQAHVDALDAHGATVALEEGTVDVAVVHRSHTRWSIRAGRYEIRVTGTKFSAGWDRRTDALTVTMGEGSVEVIGPGMKAPARVVGGQRLRANGVTADKAGAEPDVVVEDATTIAARQEAAIPELAPELPEAPAVEAEQPEAADRTASAAVRGGSRARRPAVAAPRLIAVASTEWHALETRARFKEALAAAKREGLFDDNCAGLQGRDIWRLGETARLAGDLERAEYAYQAARRFPESAPAATYGLGRIAFDQRKDYVAAGNWFESYVKRFAEAPLRREAAGLMLESRLKAGDNARARDAADLYLDLFSDGPLAPKARDIRGH